MLERFPALHPNYQQSQFLNGMKYTSRRLASWHVQQYHDCEGLNLGEVSTREQEQEG